MTKRIVFGITLSLLLMGILTLVFNIESSRAQPTTIYVDNDNTAGPWDGTAVHPYRNITSALEHASVEDTIFVCNGTYYEHVFVDKSITLLGENRETTIVDGNGAGTGILVNANNVSISDFTVRNADYGIRLSGFNSSRLSGNIVINNLYGILLYDSWNNTFRDNNMTDNRFNFGADGSVPHTGIYTNDIDTSNTVNGKPIYYLINQHDLLIDPSTFPNVGYLALLNCTNITVKNLTLTHNRHGILLWYTNNSEIRNLKVQDNLWGIIQYAGANNTITGNNATNYDWRGIQLYYSNNCTVTLNTVNNGSATAIEADHSENCSFSGNNLANNDYGIYLFESSNNNITWNNIARNNFGMELYYSSNNNSVFGNNVTASNWDGIVLFFSSSNCITGNNITGNNRDGVYLYYFSNSNRIFHNNFIDNGEQAYVDSISYDNLFDDGYPSGGNYWSDYTGVDLDNDGIGDTLHSINAHNQDNYPLMGMFYDFTVDWADSTYHLATICNSTLSNFQFGVVKVYPDHVAGPPWTTSVSFNVTGAVPGLCRIEIPKDVLDGDYIVTLDGFSMPPSMWRELPISNETTLYLYLTYPSGSHKVLIMGTTTVPEFPSFLILPIFMIATLLAVIIYRTKYFQCRRNRDRTKIILFHSTAPRLD